MSHFKNFDKPQKAPELAKHDATILDLAFIMDCTGSMGSYIMNATNSIRQIVEEIVALEKSDIKLALVEYRDHPPQETTFVVRANDFTESVKEMKKWLENCSAVGGGDEPEAVADGLQAALKLSWREKSTKICVLISDAPPHGLGTSGDSLPNGCPDGIDPIAVVDKMAEKAITLYVVGCEPALMPYKAFFSGLAYKTGGQYVPLRNASLLSKVIVGGALEDINLEKLMEEARTEVTLQQQQGIFDESELSKAVHSRLKAKGAHLPTLFQNDKSIEKASTEAIGYSKVASLSEFKQISKGFDSGKSTLYPGPAMYSGAMRDMPMRMPPGMPMASMSIESSASSGTTKEFLDETYKVVESEINEAQADRMVQKLLKRK